MLTNKHITLPNINYFFPDIMILSNWDHGTCPVPLAGQSRDNLITGHTTQTLSVKELKNKTFTRKKIYDDFCQTIFRHVSVLTNSCAGMPSNINSNKIQILPGRVGKVLRIVRVMEGFKHGRHHE